MFDIAWSELLLIAVIALIFIGPKELPQVLHTLGRMTAKLRRSADDFRRQFEDSVREAGYEDLHKNIQDFRSLNPANQLKDSIARAINQEYPPKPAAPAPEAATSSLASPLEPPKTTAETHLPQQAAVEAPGEKPGHAAEAAPAAAAPEAQPGFGSAADPAKDRIAPAA